MIDLTNHQRDLMAWSNDCIPGDVDVPTRLSRFLEEATELVQAGGMTREKAHILVDYVFARKVGDPDQEIGGVMVTLLLVAEVMGLDVERSFITEFNRIHQPAVIEKVKVRQAEKRAAGL